MIVTRSSFGRPFQRLGAPATIQLHRAPICSSRHPKCHKFGAYAPLAQLGLTRAYAMQGDRENSLKAYDDFFTIWKDADPNIPILRQAELEYKKLTASASAAVSKNQ